jgi:hypothetical protein
VDAREEDAGEQAELPSAEDVVRDLERFLRGSVDPPAEGDDAGG